MCCEIFPVTSLAIAALSFTNHCQMQPLKAWRMKSYPFTALCCSSLVISKQTHQ